MDTTDATNLDTEAPELPVQEVETEEPELDLEGDGLENEEQVEEDEELDIDGNPIKVPKSIAEKLKARMMMQADYTQKTQAVAEQRREIEQQRQAFEQEAQTRQQLFQEEAQLHGIRERLNQFQGVNWSEIARTNPQQAVAMQAEYTQLRDYENGLSRHVEGRKAEMAQMREQETATALENAYKLINTPKPEMGWDGQFTSEKREKITKFAIEKLGYAPEQISRVRDAKDVIALNLAMIGLETLQKQRQTPTRPVAQPAAKVPTSRATSNRDPAKMSMTDYAAARKAGKIV